MKSSMPIQVARYSLSLPIIEVVIELRSVDTSVVTSGKLFVFSCADCSYVVALNFFTFSESVKFFTMIRQVTPSVSSFSEYVELFPTFVIFMLVLVMLYRKLYLMYIL